MAYNNNSPRAEYTASASQTVFPFLFKIFTSSDIKVYQTPVGQAPDDAADLLTLTTDYTVTINGDAGGEITLVTGATNGDLITLLRNLEITRDIEYQSQGDLTANTLNLDQEYQTYLIADREALNERTIKISENAQGVSGTLPAPESDAYFKWSADALSIENDTTIPDAVVTSAANAAAAAASATQAQLFEWEAEAERLTADSYATEAEDVFVNLVTSDGDGTFTYTPTTDYSSLHWAAKAAAFNPALYALLTGATFTGQVKGITPVSAEDLTRKDYVDTNMVNATTEVVTNGQDWTNGISLGGGETLFPDGTIVGTNANGRYTKYPNGDLVCRHQVTTAAAPLVVTFPYTFIDTLTEVELTVVTTVSRVAVSTALTTTTVTLNAFTTTTGAAIASIIDYVAVGRWKA